MSRIDDIIAGATPADWTLREGGDRCYDFLSFGGAVTWHGPMSGASIKAKYRHLFRFIATFDPEHVALMEAVIQACDSDFDDIDFGCGIEEPFRALMAYRREHGLL